MIAEAMTIQQFVTQVPIPEWLWWLIGVGLVIKIIK